MIITNVIGKNKIKIHHINIACKNILIFVLILTFLFVGIS